MLREMVILQMETDKIAKMTREQYDAQISSAKRELKRQKEDVKKLKKELEKVVLDHKIACGYETTLKSMF